ncbi:hypothetical protein CLV63_103180 [Murinocardiopsis flavida]|uniref:Uncharacterized protein n=1 Tax=Murinocardiopsis flavida TaxID=645275 RepID=A0A2P8DQE3_9ACTN|nr:hypothetical protein [Murinocardiopsis flavida]PSK99455.1 hypothetical protein CLV63_103180 [Murinocardiopsis flavida]
MTATRVPFRHLHRDVRVLSIVLYVFAAMSLLGTAGTLVLYATNVLAFLFIIGFVFVPGAVAFLLAMLLPQGGVALFSIIVLYGIGGALTALVSIAAGVDSGILPMTFPVLILIFALKKGTRAHLLGA